MDPSKISNQSDRAQRNCEHSSQKNDSKKYPIHGQLSRDQKVLRAHHASKTGQANRLIILRCIDRQLIGSCQIAKTVFVSLAAHQKKNIRLFLFQSFFFSKFLTQAKSTINFLPFIMASLASSIASFACLSFLNWTKANLDDRIRKWI